MNNKDFLGDISATIERAFKLSPDAIIPMLNPKPFEADHSERKIHLIYETKPWMLNSGGTVHGGIIASMFDNTMGTLTRGYYKDPCVTINLSVNYFRPVPVGKSAHIEAQILETNEAGIVTLRAFAWVESGDKPAACASASFKLI